MISVYDSAAILAHAMICLIVISLDSPQFRLLKIGNASLFPLEYRHTAKLLKQT